MEKKNIDEIFKVIVKNTLKKQNDSNSASLFDTLVEEILNYHDKPATTLSELRKAKRNKQKGPIFEYFCKKYFEMIMNAENVWLLNECPIKDDLSLTRKDYGIDLVMKNKNKYFPIQCKFKYPKKVSKDNEMKYNYQNVTWRDLSTFYALCDRTGPKEGWSKYIVFTNAKYVNRKGKKNDKDKSICYNKLNNLTAGDLNRMAGIDDVVGDQINNNNYNNIMPLSEEELRSKRLEFFGKSQ